MYLVTYFDPKDGTMKEKLFETSGKAYAFQWDWETETGYKPFDPIEVDQTED